MRIGFLLLAAMLVLPDNFACGSTDTRTWTSSDGKHTVRAELVQSDGTQVKLKKSDGTVVTVKITQLSAADRRYLASRKTGAAPPRQVDPQAEKQAKARLAEIGVRVSGRELALAAEVELSKSLRTATDLGKAFAVAQSGLGAAEQQEINIKRQIMAATLTKGQLSAQLANIRVGDVSLNNKLVGALEANNARLDLLRLSLQQQERAVDGARAKANEAREAYIQSLLNARKLADSLAEQYRSLESSQELKAALSQLNEATGRQYGLLESRNFRRNVSRLEAFEKTVLSESIPLRRVGGGSLMVSVVVNGKHTQDMVLDSGANLVTLPQEIASKCGVQASAGDPQIMLSLADGSKISGHLVTIPSVRVGKFTAQNVACAVLDVGAQNAPSLLGMSFLEHFKFEVDSSQGTLTMVSVERAGAAGRRTPRSGK